MRCLLGLSEPCVLVISISQTMESQKGKGWDAPGFTFTPSPVVSGCRKGSQLQADVHKHKPEELDPAESREQHSISLGSVDTDELIKFFCGSDVVNWAAGSFLTTLSL
jgi:hypothetical protein